MKKLIFAILASSLIVSMLATGCGAPTSTAVVPPASAVPPANTQVSVATEVPTINVPTPTSVPTRAIKNDLVVILKAEPSNVDPHNNGELVAMTVQMHIFDTLVTKDMKGNILPSLATSWEQVNDKTVRFHLRNDVKFTNGEKLTAEDVRYSIQRATKMPFSSSIFSAFDGDATKVVDDYTIDVVTKAPFAGIFNYLASTRGEILPEDVVESMGTDAFGRNPVGSGPFKFDSWSTGNDIKLVRNDDYWGQKPAFSSITFNFITEAATRAIEVESGDADIAFTIASSDMPRLSKETNINPVSCNSFGYSYIIFNNQDAVMKDIRVRQALSLAIDKPSLVKAVYGDFGTVADSVLPATVFGYQSQGQSEYNLDKAKQLLTDAGYAKGLSVKLSVQDTQETDDIAEIVQNMWSKIGVKADINTLATAAYIASGRSGNNQIGISASTFGTGDPGQALADFDFRTNGVYHVNDPKIEAYMDQGMQTYDLTARAKVYQDAQKYITDQYYMIPVAFKMVLYATTKNVENFVCNPGDSTYLGDVIPYEK